MVSRWLQRALGVRQSARGATRRRRNDSKSLDMPADTESPGHDTEVVSEGPHGRVVLSEAQHGMHFFGFTRQEGHCFLRFYREKVRELQAKAGDTDHVPISGNLYMYRALAAFGDASGLFQRKLTPLIMVGLLVVMLTQVIGPVLVLFYAVHRVEFFPNGNFFGYEAILETGASWSTWVDAVSQRLLGTFFLLLFTMNGLYVLRTDKEETRKIMDMVKVFKRAARVSHYPPPHEEWLYVGAVVNSFCLLCCCFCMLFLFIISEHGPKDVLFDAFGLMFLYNLDDVGGDLGFLDEKWDAGQMGDIYGKLADDPDLVQEIQEESNVMISPDDIICYFELVQMCVTIILPLTFLVVEAVPKEF